MRAHLETKGVSNFFSETIDLTKKKSFCRGQLLGIRITLEKRRVFEKNFGAQYFNGVFSAKTKRRRNWRD